MRLAHEVVLHTAGGYRCACCRFRCGFRCWIRCEEELVSRPLAQREVMFGLTDVRSTKSSPLSTSTASATASPTASPTAPANAEYLIGGALNPTYYSTSGAFNGSGIALASQSFATNLQTSTQGSLVMYFQHHSGDIRWQQLTSTGWQGGSVSEVVANDAKNSTPLSAVAYALNGTSTWHIFCKHLATLHSQGLEFG